MTRIAIFDYGAGNLFSLKAALLRNGTEIVDVITDMKNLDSYQGLILPGVGNFDPAITSITKDISNLDSAIKGGMPILGICLGMEMLFEKSEEGKLEGLKIFKGNVVLLPKDKVKVPHMGWNNLKITSKDSTFLKGVKDGSWVYYVHSFWTKPEEHDIIAATSEYGVSVPAVIEDRNLIGVQFHPEKSAQIGSVMLKNFIGMCKGN